MSSITAGTSAGTALVHTADTTGSFVVKTGAGSTTGLTVDASQITTLANPLPVASGGTGSSSAAFVNLTSNVTGTLPVGNGGTGIATTPTNGQLDIGNGTGFTRAALTAGTGISVTNGSGSITIAASSSSYIKSDLTPYDATLSLPSALGTHRQSLAVQLTATTELIILWGSTSAFAAVWDNTTKTFGTAVLIRTAAFTNAFNVAAYSISSTSVLVCSVVTTALQTVVLSVSGSTITVNTALATTLASSSNLQNNPESNNGVGRILLVGTSYILNYSNASSQPCFRAITVSGVTPTIGSELTFAAGATSSHFVSYVFNSSVLVHISASATLLYAVPVSVSGTTLTQGTQATTTTTSANFVNSGQLSNNRIAVIYRNSTTFAAIVSITGTTASISAITLNLDGVPTSQYMQIIGTQAIVVTSQSSVENEVNVITDSSGTVVVGTKIKNPLGTSQNWAMVGANASEVFVQTIVNTPQLVSIGISGNNPIFNKVFPNIGSTSNSGTGAVLGVYPTVAFSNFENSGTMRTATYKTVTMNTGTNFFAPSFNGTSTPQIQQAVGFEISGGNTNRSSLSNAACWMSYVSATAAVNQTAYFRRVELA